MRRRLFNHARGNDRTTNPYGKNIDEKAEILRYVAEVEPRLRATSTIEIHATAPLSDVVDHLEQLAHLAVKNEKKNQ
jgi:hypothetical protein